MSTSPSASADIPGLNGGSTAPLRLPRHPLGLPAGSIRALLALLVLAGLWLLALFGNRAEGELIALTDRVPKYFIYLQFVMILILAHYFASHGSTIGKHISHRSPLALPSGSVRFVLLAGYIGLIAWLLYTQRTFQMPEEGPLFLLPLVLVAGFFVGYLITRMLRAASGTGEVPYWFQDIKAWAALLAVIGLTILFVIYLFIFPNVEEKWHFDMTTLETIVAGVVGFYFGARS